MDAEKEDETRSSLELSPKKSSTLHPNSGLNAKLEILQDFDELTEDDFNNDEPTNGDIANDSTLRMEDDANDEDEIQLPIKLPPDLTIVKEVVLLDQESPIVSPVKRGRGRPRKNPLPPDTNTALLIPAVVTPTSTSVRPIILQSASAPENIFPCSLCPRTFNTPFGRKIHEAACRRHSNAPADDSPEEILPDISIPPLLVDEPEEPEPYEDPVEVPVKRKRGRPPKIVPQPTRIETVHKCSNCKRAFTTAPGLRRHEAKCLKDLNDSTEDTIKTNIPIYSKQLRSHTNDVSLSGENLDIEEVDVKDPYAFEEGRCHCCGEDIETAHLGGEFECVDCNKLFRLKSSLERHRRVIHDEGDSYQCPECDAKCPDKGTLARHMYTHTGLKPVSCPVCKTEFSRRYHLIRHNYQTGCDGSKKPTFPCQVCGRVFNRKDNLREHLRAHAGQTKRKKRYTCEECNQEFLGLAVLNQHKRVHNPHMLDGDKPWGCEFCQKGFASQSALLKHRRKHTGERPFECTYCYARFSAKETLNRHTRTHTGYKPHQCKYCGKGFIQISQLRAHVFNHSGEGGYPCTECGKSFNRKQRLQLHIKYVHEGAEPLRCDQCDRTFLRKEDLARHQLLHSGIKEHKCPICEKCFAMKSSLKIHLLTHTKEPPRSCDECGRAFIRQDCLLRHMRTKHRGMLEEIMAEAEKKKLHQQLLAAANHAALQAPSEEPPSVLSETELVDSIRELLSLLIDETTLKAFGWPDSSVDKLLEAVIRRCGHHPAGFNDMVYADRLRENAKLLFTVVIDDTAVKTLLNNQTVDEVILHVLRLAKP